MHAVESKVYVSDHVAVNQLRGHITSVQTHYEAVKQELAEGLSTMQQQHRHDV